MKSPILCSMLGLGLAGTAPSQTPAERNLLARMPAKQTFSSAMDVGNPNNFPRLLDLCRGRIEYVRREVWF